MKSIIRLIVFVLFVTMLCACQPANPVMDSHSTPQRQNAQPKPSASSTLPSTPKWSSTTPTLPTTVPTQPTTIPTQPDAPPVESIPFAYEWIEEFAWGKREDMAAPMPGEYILNRISSPQEAVAYGCPADSEYMDSEFFENNSLILVDFVEPILQVEFAVTNLVENEDGSYHIEIDRFYNDPGSEAISHTAILIEVNRAMSEDTEISVSVADKLVDYPVGEA